MKSSYPTDLDGVARATRLFMESILETEGNLIELEDY